MVDFLKNQLQCVGHQFNLDQILLLQGEDQVVLLKCEIKEIFKYVNPHINIITNSNPAVNLLKQEDFKSRPKAIGLVIFNPERKQAFIT